MCNKKMKKSILAKTKKTKDKKLERSPLNSKAKIEGYLIQHQLLSRGTLWEELVKFSLGDAVAPMATNK